MQMEDTYEEKIHYLNKFVALDNTTIYGEDLLTLISLVNLLTMANRKKKPDLSPLDVLTQLNPPNQNRSLIFLNERVSLMCEMLLIPGSTFRNFGFKTKEEIVTEIRRILDSWIPF